jgi:AmmeMemoRadiSam system protein B/AmmeMemoRadiSam system protein A
MCCIGKKVFLVVTCFSLIFFPAINPELLAGKEVTNQTKELTMKETGSSNQIIRPSAVAGAFYTSDPDDLTAEIKKFLDNVPSSKPLPGTIVALISPHAGYIYSGQVAAHGFKLLEGKSFDTVVVLAPSHRIPFRGASVFPQGAYQIPLGLIPIDKNLAENLIKSNDLFSYVPSAHVKEHSLEVQLPFLKIILGNFMLVPIVMGSNDFSTCNEIAETIYQTVKDQSVLIVASTDLSHFHPYQDAVNLDRIVIDHVKHYDPQGLFKAIATGKCEACGADPLVTTMLLAKKLGANQSKLLNYANSGDVSGDKTQVVGYMSAVLYKDKVSGDTLGITRGLSDKDKKTLHTIAQTAIESHSLGKPFPEIDISSQTLKEKRGAFVTLHKHGNLRGCIGYIRGQKPLHQTIREMAIAAAFQDSRFKPVTQSELVDLDIEISVLTPLEKISDVEKITVGKHGIYIIKDYSSGLLLPQVATEQEWDRKTFLEHTCTKAGLPEDAWKDPSTEIYIFSADIF